MPEGQKTEEKGAPAVPDIDLRDLEVVERLLADLSPHPRNPRVHDEAAGDKEFPMLRRAYEILKRGDDKKRLAAAKHAEA